LKRRGVLATRLDPVLGGSALALVVIGILFIYSSNVTAGGAIVSRETLKQIIWAVLGVGVMVFLALFGYGRLRALSLYIYGGNLLLLVVTLVFGQTVNGARSWLGFWELGIQPSEFMKISTVLFLGTYFAGIGNGVRELPRFLLGLLIILLPMGFILLQPDMGTALVLIPVFLVMAFIAGADPRHLWFIVLVGVLGLVLAASPSLRAHSGSARGSFVAVVADPDMLKYLIPAAALVGALSALGYRSFRRQYFFWIAWAAGAFVLGASLSLLVRVVLKDYQIMRLVIFVNPRLDPQGAGWNIIQSVTAIGSGGLFGKGFLRGTQSHYQFLPQQSTDFIFSILAEEWGFLGALGVFALYLVLLLRGMSLLWAAKEDYGLVVGTGILTMIFFHLLVNVGMAMGIMPVTGIPLLFLSYGGSSLWTALGGVGILMSIGARRGRGSMGAA
jgi:rod shape determining protein RodA